MEKEEREKFDAYFETVENAGQKEKLAEYFAPEKPKEEPTLFDGIAGGLKDLFSTKDK